jgi:hypothetical protein
MSTRNVHKFKRDKKIVYLKDEPELYNIYLCTVIKKGNEEALIFSPDKLQSDSKINSDFLQNPLANELDELSKNLQLISNSLNGNVEDKIKNLNSITRNWVEQDSSNNEKSWKKIATYSIVVFASMLVGHFILSYLPLKEIGSASLELYRGLDSKFSLMILAGFVAQLVDGALGMGYGVTSATIFIKCRH